jgi:outer membrane protein
MRALLAAALVNLCPLLAMAADAGAPPASSATILTQDEVVRRVLERSAALRASRARHEATAAEAQSARGRLLPSISLSEEVQYYNAAFPVTFPPPIGTVVARDQTASAFTAAAEQPLLGLLHLGEDAAARGSAEGAAKADLLTAEAAVKEAVVTELLHLFEARELGRIAHASVEQLTEQLQVARARLGAGVITRADVLRIETAAANARQDEIQAAAVEQSQRAGLLVALGESPEAKGVDFADPVLSEPSEVEALSTFLARARVSRPELESARLTRESAVRRARARGYDLFPEVTAEAAYLHVTGQAFAPRDASFVGVRAEWPIWDWGAKWHLRSAALADEEAAAAEEADEEDRVAVDVSSRFFTMSAAGHAVEVARTAIESAEEAYRVTDALLRAGSATTTDLLDSQAALTTARSNLARARYNYALTRLELARADGEL